tara:strand:- start:312 stop:488 length:177 start_codon:yes stop_codon:yes gene_type:complete
MINIISTIITWLKGYRKISPKYTPHIPEKPRDKYGGNNPPDKFAKTEGYINSTSDNKK